MPRFLICIVAASVLWLHFTPVLWSQAPNPAVDRSGVSAPVEKTASVEERVAHNQAAMNLMWTLLTGFLVMFMQAGFALVETGMTRSKNVAHTMAMNLMVYAIGMLGFYFVGFGLMFGGYHSEVALAGSFGGPPTLTSEFKIGGFGLFGTDGFLLLGHASTSGVLAVFLFQLVFMDASATIATGAMAERWKFFAFVLYCVFVSTIIYPIYGNWVWGGGWLAKLGSLFRLGHGHVDFAGSSVVHMTGGVLALVGARMLGPRLGKYNADGTLNVLPAHSVPMYVLGTLILAFGWFGFNAGSTNAATDMNIARIAVNTMLASGSGAVTAMMICMWRVGGRPDPSFLCNGMLAGLVSITAPGAFVAPWAAVLIGGVAGVLVIGSCVFFEKIARIDDPVGAISVHGVNGVWGVLALGLFADGTYGRGWNNTFWARSPANVLELFNSANDVPAGWTTVGVTGLFFGNPSQLGAQLFGIVANIVWVVATGYAMFWIIEKVVGNRVSPLIEVQGLDVAEMGIVGYIDEDPTAPEGHLKNGGQEPRAARVPPDGHKRFTVVVEGVAPERISTLWSELCRPNANHSADFFALYRQFTLLQGNRFRFISGDPEKMRELLTNVLRAADGGKSTVRTEIEPAAERTPLWS